LVVSSAGGEPNSAFAATEESFQAQRKFRTALDQFGWPGETELFSRRWHQAVTQTQNLKKPGLQFPEVDTEVVLSQLFPALDAPKIRLLAVLHEAANNPCAPMPGALHLVRSLATAKVKLGIVSNAQFYTPLLLEALWGSSPETLGFASEMIFYSFEEGSAKPGPQLYEKAFRTLKGLGVDPMNTLMIGNSVANDILPAQKTGFMTALFAGDTRSFRPQPNGLPDTVLTRFSGPEIFLK
jgi:putative hydrolase of the HAD superfamily